MRPPGRWLSTCRSNVMPKEGNEIPADILVLAERPSNRPSTHSSFHFSSAACCKHCGKSGRERTSRRQGSRRACDGFRRTEHRFEFARKPLQGKDPNDVMALHAEYVNNQIAVFMEQGKELARRAAKMAGQDPKH